MSAQNCPPHRNRRNNQQCKEMHCIFGPVPSRRLGRSLGVDLVPFKTCTYDCIYCQLGRTTHKTVERRQWVQLEDVLRELKSRLNSRPDYITLSGSGEPTLYSRLDELIGAIKDMTNIPVAVLTNGSLLWQSEVRKQLLQADVVIPSLDAGDEVHFRAINRPHPQISFDQMVNGLRQFRQEYRGQYWLEVFLLKGYTAIQAEVKKLAQLTRSIHPDKVQLNTVDRPPAEAFALPVPIERMQQLAVMFEPPAEITIRFRGRHNIGFFKVNDETLLNLLHRRPCTMEQISEGLGWHLIETSKMLTHLESNGLIGRQDKEGAVYYQAVETLDHKSQQAIAKHSKTSTHNTRQ